MVEDGWAATSTRRWSWDTGARWARSSWATWSDWMWLDIARSLRAAYGDRYAPPALLERMVAEGKRCKSGQGFYAWSQGSGSPSND